MAFSDSLGIYVAAIQAAAQPVFARTSSGRGLFWFSFYPNLKLGSQVSIDGQPNPIYLRDREMAVAYLPLPVEMSIPANSLIVNVSILATPEFIAGCLTHCRARTMRLFENVINIPSKPAATVGRIPPDQRQLEFPSDDN
mgnify:FL=1